MIRKNRWKSVDILRRRIFLKFEIKKILLTSFALNTYMPLSYRYWAQFNKSKLIRWSSITQQKKKCIQTGRVWSTVKHVKYSRFLFRTESYQGNLPGFKRASW